MTVELLLLSIMEKHNIPKNVTIKSDSGWECCETEMDGIYYNRKLNTMVFTQSGTVSDDWFDEPGWELIYGNNEKCQGCRNLDDHKYCTVRYKFAVGIHDTRNCELCVKDGNPYD